VDIINDNQRTFTDEQKMDILKKFFDVHEREIIEMINDKLCEFIHYEEYED
jgi:hypothetical protein